VTDQVDRKLVDFILSSVGTGAGREQFMAGLRKIMEAMPQVELRFDHQFCPGIYGRKMSAPQGALILGAKHALPNFVVLLSGSIAVADEMNGARILHAPIVECCPAGLQRLGYCLTAVEWMNFFPTPETDLTKLAGILSEPEPEEAQCLLL